MAYTILSTGISTAGTYTSDWLKGLGAFNAASFELYSSLASGTGLTMFLQTSFDSGATAIDIAAIACSASGITRKGILVTRHAPGVTAATTGVDLTDGAMSAGTVLQGVLGDMLRVKYVVAGTFASNSILRVSAVTG